VEEPNKQFPPSESLAIWKPVLKELCEKTIAAWCDVWGRQGEELNAEFYNAVFRDIIRELIKNELEIRTRNFHFLANRKSLSKEQREPYIDEIKTAASEVHYYFLLWKEIEVEEQGSLGSRTPDIPFPAESNIREKIKPEFRKLLNLKEGPAYHNYFEKMRGHTSREVNGESRLAAEAFTLKNARQVVPPGLIEETSRQPPDQPPSAPEHPKYFEGLPQKKQDLSGYFFGLTQRQLQCSSLKWEYELSDRDIGDRLGIDHSTS